MFNIMFYNNIIMELHCGKYYDRTTRDFNIRTYSYMRILLYLMNVF